TFKQWSFNLSGSQYTLLSSYYEVRNWATFPLAKGYNWAQDAAGNTYLQTVVTYLDQPTSSSVYTIAVQTRDTYGNLIQSQVYDYPAAGTLLRQFDLTYENGSNYVSRYIRNRLKTATV